MSRGGVRKERDGPERRCAVTGERGAPERMIRFVLGPDGAVAPDVAEKLPGRGVWIGADRALLERAIRKNAFARSLKTPARAPDGLIELVERLLTDRTISALAIARKSGLAVAGFEKVRETRRPAALVQAVDGAADGKRKLRRLFPDAAEITWLTSVELGLAFGRAYAIHAALVSGGATSRFLREAMRLQGVRQPSLRDGGDATTDGSARDAIGVEGDDAAASALRASDDGDAERDVPHTTGNKATE